MSIIDITEHLKARLQQKRKDHPSFRLLDIDENLFPNGIIRFETKAKDSDNKLRTVKDIVAESWKKGEKNHLMIQGEGGIGKTVTLLSLPVMFNDHTPPAIYIPLHELKGGGIDDLIECYIKKRILDDDEELFQQLKELRKKEWNNGPCLLLLLDGFNEIPNERRGTISEDIEHWSEDYPGVQIITSSRFDIHQYVALRSSFSKIELQPLSEDTVLEYLKSNNFDTPRSSAITKLITIPLLLTLYIKTETIRREQPAPFAKFLETKNAGTLIWNYLQCELWRFRNNSRDGVSCVLAMEFIAPYVAWIMQQHSEFFVNESSFLDRIGEAYNLMKKHIDSNGVFPDHIKTTLQQSTVFADNVGISKLLKESLCLFIGNEGHYKLMHQQFRDALAAMHLINSIYLNGNSRPTEWNPIVDHYVMQFVADLISEDEANRLWEQNRTSPQLETATRNQLELQRQLHNCDFSKLDFSGLDLSNISLYPYRYTNATIKLPSPSERMVKIKLSAKTFSPEGHKGLVNAVAVTPDGKRIVSGSGDKTIRVWDLEAGAPIGSPIEGHEGWVNTIAVTPDGKRIVSGSGDKTIRVWDLETGAPIGSPIEGHKGSVHDVAVTPDGKRIVSGSGDKTIRVKDLETGVLIGSPIKEHKKSVNAVAVTPDGKCIVSGSNDHTIRVWDLETGAPIVSHIVGLEDSVDSVVVTPDGKRIVSGSRDNTIRVWDLKTDALIGSPIEGHKDWVNAVAVTLDGKRIVSGSADGTICITDIETREVKTIKIHPLSFLGLDFSKAIISTPELKETLRQNGAIV